MSMVYFVIAAILAMCFVIVYVLGVESGKVQGRREEAAARGYIKGNLLDVVPPNTIRASQGLPPRQDGDTIS